MARLTDAAAGDPVAYEAGLRYLEQSGYVFQTAAVARAFTVAATVRGMGWAAAKDLLPYCWDRYEAELMADLVSTILGREDALRGAVYGR